MLFRLSAITLKIIFLCGRIWVSQSALLPLRWIPSGSAEKLLSVWLSKVVPTLPDINFMGLVFVSHLRNKRLPNAKDECKRTCTEIQHDYSIRGVKLLPGKRIFDKKCFNFLVSTSLISWIKSLDVMSEMRLSHHDSDFHAPRSRPCYQWALSKEQQESRLHESPANKLRKQSNFNEWGVKMRLIFAILVSLLGLARSLTCTLTYDALLEAQFLDIPQEIRSQEDYKDDSINWIEVTKSKFTIQKDQFKF